MKATKLLWEKECHATSKIKQKICFLGGNIFLHNICIHKIGTFKYIKFRNDGEVAT